MELRLKNQVWARGATCLVYTVDIIVFHELSMLHHILTNQVWARAKVLKVPKVNVSLGYVDFRTLLLLTLVAYNIFMN